MTASQKFTVAVTGEVELGQNIEQAKAAFASLFKISDDKAEAYFQGKPRVLRRDLAPEKAQAYLRALQNMGLICKMIPQAPEPQVQAPPQPQSRAEAASVAPAAPHSSPSMPEPASAAPAAVHLEMVPIESERGMASSPGGASVSPGARQEMVCPKCEARQPPADECVRCGIIFAKYTPAQEPEGGKSPTKSRRPSHTSDQLQVETPVDSANLVAIAFAAVAATAGAWAWYLIAMATGFEFSLVAWAIGGLVGGAAALAGGRGAACGVICAICALAAILGGKYLIMEGFKEELSSMMSGFTEMLDTPELNKQMDAFFEETKADAARYHELDGSDQSLREFLYSRDYSDASSASAVTQADIDAFNTFHKPTLEWVYANNPDYQAWQAHAMGAINEVSAVELIKQSFGILDALFLFLGLGTAFRLGSAGR